MTIRGSVYDFPLWYERAFMWRDYATEARFLLESTKRFAMANPSRVIELLQAPPYMHHFYSSLDCIIRA